MARYALVIGVAKYENFSNLPKAATDAEAVAQLLEDLGYDVQRLPGKLIQETDRWTIASDKSLKEKELGEGLRYFVLEKAKGSEAIVYFAGHGFEAASWDGEKEGYLATSNADKTGKNAIGFDRLKKLIGKSELGSLVMLLDCCYAGALLERSLLQPMLSMVSQKQNYCLMTACRAGERAREGLEHGVFTAAVLEALSADNAAAGVTSSDLFGFVARIKNSGQEPIQAGMGAEIVLVRSQHPEVASQIDETCPYQGLTAFDKETAQFFFGRQRVVEQLRQKLEESNFVPLIGASGSGKSSVVRAGLIPALEANGWQVLDPIKPGFEPVGELKRAFASWFRRAVERRRVLELIDLQGLEAAIQMLPGTERILLVVDQFEEIFTVCPREGERRKFIELLTRSHSSRLTVVTTMRADFVGDCLNYGVLTEQLQHHAVLIPPLEGANLRDAIVKPAQMQGYTFDSGLLTVILRDIEREKNCLPLLQFALRRLWEKATSAGHRLTLEQYEQLGGIQGALNHHAQWLYDNLTPEEREWVQRICMKLVRTGKEARDTRQRQLKSELLALAGDDRTAQEMVEIVLAEFSQLVAEVVSESNSLVFMAKNITYAEDYIEDLIRLLKLYREVYPEPDPSITDEIESVDLEFLLEDLPKIVSSMRVGFERVQKIIRPLTTFSQNDNRDNELTKNTVDLHEGMESTLMILKHRLKANSKRPEIEIIRDYGSLPKIECFAGKLDRVFMNILANAIDAVEESNEGRTYDEIKQKPNIIRIKTEMNCDRNTAVILISDNGVGMTEEIKQKIFDPFFTTKPVGKGTGLGLSIAYQIVVEQHGGQLICNSILGEGSEFTIEIPIKPIES